MKMNWMFKQHMMKLIFIIVPPIRVLGSIVRASCNRVKWFKVRMWSINLLQMAEIQNNLELYKKIFIAKVIYLGYHRSHSIRRPCTIRNIMILAKDGVINELSQQRWKDGYKDKECIDLKELMLIQSMGDQGPKAEIKLCNHKG